MEPAQGDIDDIDIDKLIEEHREIDRKEREAASRAWVMWGLLLAALNLMACLGLIIRIAGLPRNREK
jgi:hypothetical protein